jgi:hypothetical protein
MANRRNFIKISSFGSLALLGNLPLACSTFSKNREDDLLTLLSSELLESWMKALLKLRNLDQSDNTVYGGIICPACGRVHGRSADTMYPLLYMADRTQQSDYHDSAVLLYRWMEKNVSQPDGSWLNDPVNHSWKGITVFTAIAIAESLKNHGAILEKSFRSELENRLKKAGDYIYENFSVKFGNINYPVTASYGLSLIGTIRDIKGFRGILRMKHSDFLQRTIRFLAVKADHTTSQGPRVVIPSI